MNAIRYGNGPNMLHQQHLGHSKEHAAASVAASQEGFGKLVQTYKDSADPTFRGNRITHEKLLKELVAEIKTRVGGQEPARILEEYIAGNGVEKTAVLFNTKDWHVKTENGDLLISGPDLTPRLTIGTPAPISSLVLKVGRGSITVIMRDLDPLPGGFREFNPKPEELAGRKDAGVDAIDPNGPDYQRIHRIYDLQLGKSGIAQEVRGSILAKREKAIEAIRVQDCFDKAKEAVEKKGFAHAIFQLGDTAFFKTFSDSRSFHDFIKPFEQKGHYVGSFHRSS